MGDFTRVFLGCHVSVTETGHDAPMNFSSHNAVPRDLSDDLFDPEPHESSTHHLRFDPRDRESVERYRLGLERRLGRSRPLAIVGGSSSNTRGWWRRLWTRAA